MRYRAVHTTRYNYETAVSQCQSEVRLTPRTLPWQSLVESTIATTPESASIQRYTDYFGNDVTAFTILESHDRFVTEATSVIEVHHRAAPVSDATWDGVRDRVAAQGTPSTIQAYEFVLASPFVPVDPELADYARPSFGTGQRLVAGVEHLAHRLHDDFRYEPRSTSVDTAVLETLRARRGVCQDFAHVMIGALRSIGLAARYVSGYLRSGGPERGAEASHAWVSVFLPEHGWFDIDPTNDVRPELGHVTLAWGRDYGDVTPVKGVALGGGKQLVDVEVRVDPV